MNIYCPNCDKETEQTVEKRERLVGKGEQTWYTCTECSGGRNYIPPSPPVERTFEFDCSECKEITTFNWCKDYLGSNPKGWDRYECSKCHRENSFPINAKKRKKHQEWIRKGCPNPWWFRPTQVLVVLTLIVLSYLFPWVMLSLYLLACYSLVGYGLLSKRLFCDGLVDGLWTFLLAPVGVPVLFIFFALRAPVL